MKISVGDKAPNFCLRNTFKKEVSLSDFGGQNVVLLFFPFAFTGTCTSELCSVRDENEQYTVFNANVLAISVDSPFCLAKFKDEEDLNFDLLSDFNKEVSRAYGTLYEEFSLELKGVSKRSAFVIDKNGTIQYAEVLEHPRDLPNFEQIKATLGKLN